MNISASSNKEEGSDNLAKLKEKCDDIYEYWEEHFEWKIDLDGNYEDLYLARLCPVQFCAAPEPLQEIDPSYLGATTDTEKNALIWVSRTSAILSFLGASYILYDILSVAARRATVANQLLLGMAIFDIITAFAWSFATAPIDSNNPGTDHVMGAIGNEATCMTQAFFIQLGFGSIFYNVSLSLYYVLVVAYGWREFQLKKIQRYLHGLPVIAGLGLALGGIPIYHWFEYGCHILPPPDGELWVVLVFVVLPLGLSIVAITASVLVVYGAVLEQANASRKWRFGVGTASSTTKAVFWQCICYVLAFYITWPILFGVYLKSIDLHGPLSLSLAVAFVAPLQGFNNFLVYIRPRVFRSSTTPTHQGRERGSGSTDSESLSARVIRLSQSLWPKQRSHPNCEDRKEKSNPEIETERQAGCSTLDDEVALDDDVAS